MRFPLFQDVKQRRLVLIYGLLGQPIGPDDKEESAVRNRPVTASTMVRPQLQTHNSKPPISTVINSFFNLKFSVSKPSKMKPYKCDLFLAPLWSSGQSFWLQIQRSRVRFPALPDFLSSSGSGTGSTQPREVN